MTPTLDDGAAATLRTLIAEAVRVYEAAGLDCGHRLLPPADEAAIDAVEAALTLPVPHELRALYAIHGGQDYVDPGITGLFGEHRLLTPAELVELHTLHRENYYAVFDPPPTFPPNDGERGHWVPDLLPFAEWDAYALCLHVASGEVWEFLPSSGLIKHRPSIAAVLEEVVATVRAGGEPRLRSPEEPGSWASSVE